MIDRHHLIALAHDWRGVIGSAVASVGFGGLEDTGLLDGAPKSVHVAVWASVIVSAVAGAILAVAKVIRDQVDKSDKKTAAVVKESTATISTDLATAMREEMAAFKEHQTRALATVGPRLVSIDSNLRDIGDVRSEMIGMATQVGSLEVQVSGLAKDVDHLHKWKREHIKDHEKGDALLRLWAEEYKRKKLEGESTPPHGWTPPEGA